MRPEELAGEMSRASGRREVGMGKGDPSGSGISPEGRGAVWMGNRSNTWDESP